MAKANTSDPVWPLGACGLQNKKEPEGSEEEREEIGKGRRREGREEVVKAGRE